ncbi:Leucine aminopeptidase 1 [Mortierella hygrophila]|uniref:Peptide hydrolase n=1 Tax=Mortierella hygrophila TaxID=979708 RepID=A0A9P6F3X4_9FUNG|nr:Leucine aminopeptidase 1 [Mortierella hygrophila]
MVKDTVVSHVNHFSNNINGDRTLRLVQTAEDKAPVWTTEGQRMDDLIEESDADSDPAIVGAHQDSVNDWNTLWGRSPGADDDSSGTATTLEVFRSFVGTGFRPTRPVEFHWYSAEEVGLLGSQDVAKSYEKRVSRSLA